MGCCQSTRIDQPKISQSNSSRSLSSELRYNWSDLPEDILRLTSTKLAGIIDIMHLRAVCKNWCSAISPPTPLAQPPWVFLDDHHIPKSLKFVSLDRSDFCINLPEVENMQLVGITYNYMVLLDETKNAMFLVNPITGKINPLPPFPRKYPRARFMEVDPVQSSNTIIIRSRARQNLFLLICQPGDKEWKIVRVPFLYFECAYFNGLYYIHKLHEILVFELNTGAMVDRLSHPLEIPMHHRFSYLIESFGELIGVCRNQRWCDSVKEYRFGIFRLNNEEGALANNKWVKINTIEDRILFLNFRSGFCLRVNNFPGLEKNSIYFVSAKCFSPPVSYDLCRYDITKGRTEKLKRVNSMLAYWFFPSLR